MAVRHHKTAQLCSQVQRALGLALLSECDDEVLQELNVESVDPAPDDRRLSVTLVVPERVANLGRDEITQRLEAARGVLTQQVMQSIHRRRCPQLSFVLAREGGPEPVRPDDSKPSPS